MFNLYKNRKMTLKYFQFNPKNSRLETPSANRSHKYETR
ncbi:GH-E family nuclease [Lactiplantibacillus plantarum]|nr:GH-E family nuclease [Lactiplantibacillus plantarum]WBV38029.1 GH-E family nuclease [Lactiplantibacillus plantarum]